jgi:hypothetical protein
LKEKALTQAQQAVKDYETDAVNKPTAVTALAQIQALSAITTLPSLPRRSFSKCPQA